MRLRRVRLANGVVDCQLKGQAGWGSLTLSPDVDKFLASHDLSLKDGNLLPLFQLPGGLREQLKEFTLPVGEQGEPLLPVVPESFRDFMLHEKHVISASRGMAKRFMPTAYWISRCWEMITRRDFPAFRPSKLWYQKPIYYLSGHKNIVTTGTEMPWPGYCSVLDYELEIGAFLGKSIRNATTMEVMDAVAGFVVLNDFSARNVQIAEMRSGFGPQKAKHFGSSISAELVTADEIIPHIDNLNCSVSINGRVVSTSNTSGGHFSIFDAISYASTDETLYPGELFGTGTISGCSGVESGWLVAAGDELMLQIDRIGTLVNKVGKKAGDQ